MYYVSYCNVAASDSNYAAVYTVSSLVHASHFSIGIEEAKSFQRARQA